MDLNEVCLTCHSPRGEHLRERLAWMQTNNNGVLVKTDFWQDDICPWPHNWTQPNWDKYLFRGNSGHAERKGSLHTN